MEADLQEGVPGVDTPPQTPGVFDEVSTMLAFVREALSDFLELVSLEARGAGLALVWMIVGGLIAAILIVIAWAGLMAALVMYVVSLGMLPIAAIILVAALNLLAGAGVLYGCLALSRRLLFMATRRQLMGDSRIGPAAP